MVELRPQILVHSYIVPDIITRYKYIVFKESFISSTGNYQAKIRTDITNAFTDNCVVKLENNLCKKCNMEKRMVKDAQYYFMQYHTGPPHLS